MHVHAGARTPVVGKLDKLSVTLSDLPSTEACTDMLSFLCGYWGFEPKFSC